MTAEIKLEGLVYDLPDSEYHKVLAPDKAHYSSSQFKDAMKDIEFFHKKYISKEIVDEHSTTTLNNFAVGHAYHCLTLEPLEFTKQFVIFEGAVKRGKAYEDCLAKATLEGKKVLTQKQYDLAKFIADASDKNEISKELRGNEGSIAEVSCFVVLHGVKVKVRADLINFEGFDKYDGNFQVPFIADMKSTTGNPKDAEVIMKKIASLNYDLSAALYLDAFNVYLGEKGLPLIEEWKFIFDSKDSGTSKVWTATEDMIKVGRAKYMKGLELIKKYQANGWVFEDSDDLIDVASWDKLTWIKKTETKQVVEDDADLL